jgi:hypothetical protein
MRSNAAGPIINVGWATPEVIGFKNHALLLGEGAQQINQTLACVRVVPWTATSAALYGAANAQTRSFPLSN